MIITEEKFFETYKIGDIITAHHAGFHKIVRVEKRLNRIVKDIPVGEEMNCLVHYQKVLTNDGLSVNTKVINCCDPWFIKPARDFIRNKIKTLQEIDQTIIDLQNKL